MFDEAAPAVSRRIFGVSLERFALLPPMVHILRAAVTERRQHGVTRRQQQRRSCRY
jgi:hypothetical protein